MKRAEVGLRMGHLMLFSCSVIIFHIVFSYARGLNNAKSCDQKSRRQSAMQNVFIKGSLTDDISWFAQGEESSPLWLFWWVVLFTSQFWMKKHTCFATEKEK